MVMVKFRDYPDDVKWVEHLGWLIDVECSSCGKDGRITFRTMSMIDDDDDIECYDCGLDC